MGMVQPVPLSLLLLVLAATTPAAPRAAAVQETGLAGNWRGALWIHAPNASDAYATGAPSATFRSRRHDSTADLHARVGSPPLCTRDCALVRVGTAANGTYYIGSYNTAAGASANSSVSCRSLCLRTAWCVQLTFVHRAAAACVLYSSIGMVLAAPTPTLRAWVKCAAKSTVAAKCAAFAPPPPAPTAPVQVPAQMLRKTFQLQSPLRQVSQAILRTSATGFVQAYVNGKNVAPAERLNPGRSSLDMRRWYMSHDVTDDLIEGANAIGFLVGRGWQYMEADAALSAWGGNPARSAHQATVAGVLTISYSDATVPQQVVTDTTWTTSTDGPIVAHNIYGFEIFDARRQDLDICAGGPVLPSGQPCDVPWATASFDDSGGTWKAAEEMEEYPNATVSQQIVRPIRQLQLVKAVSVTPVVVSNGPTPLTVYIFDMGQNAAGGVQLVVPSGCPAGHRILMYFGEVLYSINGSAPRARVSGPPSQGVLGTVDQSNLLGARGRVEYICAGSNVSDLYEPSFTYFGYQYVELVGFPGVPGLDTVQQRVMHSDVESTPSDTGLPRTPCGAIDMGGNQMLQYISSAVRETLISNLYSVPTDCPQRSERWGWMADGSLSAEANYHYHWVGDMYTSWLTLMQDVQNDRAAGCKVVSGPQGDNNLDANGMPNCSGAVGIITPGVSPLSTLQSLPGEASWSVAYPLLFSLQHRYMADIDLARKMFPGVLKYVSYLDWVARNSTVSGLVSFVQFGDWLSPRPSKIVDEMSSAFNHAQAIRIVRDTAMALDEDDHAVAQRYDKAYADAQRGFHSAYFRNGTYGNGEQAALVYALYLDSMPTKALSEVVLAQLLDSIQSDPACRPCLLTGILSTKWLMETLSLYGRTDVALSLALKTERPSWGHMMVMNATTISESWGSVDELPPLRTSRSHPALASVGAWFFRWIAGLRLADNTPGLAPPGTYGRGYARTLFAPGCVTNSRVPHASARITSVHGKIISHWAWHSANRSLLLELTLPANTSADIQLPAVIQPHAASVAVEGGSANMSRLVWHHGEYVPGVAGVTGAKVVAPSHTNGGGDGRTEIISISVSAGAHRFVAL